MNEIIINNLDGKLTVSSLQVANDFEKQHKDVIRSIENLKAQNCALKEMFIENSYKVDGNNNANHLYSLK